MPSKPIQFGAGQASSYEALGGAPQLAVNLLVDAAGWITLFPGAATFSDFGTTAPRTARVVAMTDWKGSLIWVDQAADGTRYCYALTGPGVIKTLSTTTASTQVGGSLPPTFAKTKDYIVIAGGAQMSYWDGAAATLAAIPDPQAPPSVTNVVAIAQRVVALPYDSTGTFFWSDAGVGNTLNGWRALNFAEAESQPDTIVSLQANSRELYAVGTETLQVFTPDANVIFSPQATVETGTFARSSVLNLLERQALVFLDHRLDIVVADGRGVPEVISGPINRDLKNLTSPSECEAFRITMPNADILGFSFPTSGRTFCYEIGQKRWFELRGQSTSSGYQPWPATSHFHWKEKSKVLVGLASGVIQELSTASTSIDGLFTYGEAVSGFEDRGTLRDKQTQALRSQMRRGEHGLSDVPFVELQYRDRPGAWSNPLRFSGGSTSDKRPIIEKRVVCRPYGKRQWRLRLAVAGLAVGPLEEDFEIMEY